MCVCVCVCVCCLVLTLCVCVCVCVCVCSGSGVGGREGGGGVVEEAVWQQDLPTVPSSVYTHMHSCVPHNPILP